MRMATGMLAVGLMLGGAGGVHAETLPVEGIYAAATDAPSRARSIALADFAGRPGERLAFAIDSALRSAVIEGRPWFAVTFTAPAFGDRYTYDGGANLNGGGPSGGRGGTDAVMRGIAQVNWRDVDAGTKEGEECEKYSGSICISKKKVSYVCSAREVTFRPEVRLVSREGEMLYGKADTLTASRRYCEDDRTPPQVDSMVEELAGTFALAVRRDIAPEYRAEDIRILEGRDGIRKEDREAFKAAIRLTKTDVPGACEAFAALEAANPADVSVLFNIGLCHESAGDLDEAEAHYRTVMGLRRGRMEAQAGLDRIASRLRAERQMELRAQTDPRPDPR
jgi:hypothetical protein